MVKSLKTWISRERNITFLQNKNIFNLCPQPTHFVNLTLSYGYILLTYVSYFLLTLMLRNLNYAKNSDVAVTLAQLM